MARESRYMHFIDDASTKRSIERLISLPIKSAQISQYTFHACRGVVSRVTCGSSIIVPANGYTFPIRVE